MKEKINIKNIYYYLQGNIRYKLYYSKFAWLIPKYIKEQINMRIASMSKDCYKNGFCTMCGCQTTMLQMANKACNKPCYPVILNKNKWDKFKKDKIYFGVDFWSITNDFNTRFKKL